MLDDTVGDDRTRFLDMPVVTVGTASNNFSALKDSLEKHGLEFSKTVVGHAQGFKSSLKKRILNCMMLAASAILQTSPLKLV